MSLCLEEVSVLTCSLRGWGLPMNYLHLGLCSADILTLRVCDYLPQSGWEDRLQSIFEANGLK